MPKFRDIKPITGFALIPSLVSSVGTVTFTDGTNDIVPNQLQCEAYGYTYDKVSGTCSAFSFSTNLGRTFSNLSNSISGQGNTTQTGTTNTYIMGENNTIRGLSRNNIVVGNNNEIANSVNNANVYGTLGEATATNSIVLGGNASSDNLGERQNMTFMYGKQTTDGSTVDAFLNNTTDSYFVVPLDTAIYFQSETLVVRVGGSAAAGAVGDFKSWVERGVVINKSGTLSIQRSRTSPASSGTTTSWSPVNSVSGTNFLQQVTGKADMTLEWASTIRMTQIKTGVALP
tara:strand:+ start:457 stop:1317 length:861 start_codon:yes stop_codon:yes gene_type:complete